MNTHIKDHLDLIEAQLEILEKDLEKQSSILSPSAAYGINSEFGKIFSITKTSEGYANIQGFVQDCCIFEATVSSVEVGVKFFFEKIKEFIQEVYGDTKEKIPFDIHYG